MKMRIIEVQTWSKVDGYYVLSAKIKLALGYVETQYLKTSRYSVQSANRKR